uniref:Uncharacterized protein n=1 Tax=Ascaris lumbricoides TaxID=6252 RepID=A0A0M3HPQ9_ASCLU
MKDPEVIKENCSTCCLIRRLALFGVSKGFDSILARLALNHQFIIAVKEIRTDAFNVVHIRNNTNSFIIDGEGQQVPSVTSKQQPEI